MGYFYDKKVLSFVKTEFLPANLQEKTITPQNFTPEITPDSGYSALSKVKLKGILVDTHQSYTSQTDDTVAYQKTTPTGALNYASLDKIGGMSYKSENLIVLNDVAETTTSGITYSVSNGTININGTAETSFGLSFEFLNEIPIGTYSMSLFVSGTTTATNPWGVGKTTSTYDFLIITTAVNKTTTDILKYLWRTISNGSVWTNYKITPMIITGSTAPTEFKQGFTSIRNSAITSVVSKDSNNTTLETKTIPAEIQALTGYGWGVNSSVYNYIDYESKKFIQKVARVDMGTLTWNLASANRFNSTNISTLAKRPTSDSTQANILCAIFTSWYKTSIESVPNRIAIDTGGAIWTSTDGSYANANAFKTAMSGVYLYYELATPVETDISQYIDNNFIEVEAGGTTTFNNTYEQAVPSEITYLKEVQ